MMDIAIIGVVLVIALTLTIKTIFKASNPFVFLAAIFALGLTVGAGISSIVLKLN